MKDYRLGILGAGNMGRAIVDGAVRGGLLAAGEALLFNRAAEKRAANEKLGFAVTDDFCEVYRRCETVLLAVKPQNFDEVLPKLAAAGVADKPLVVSIAAGVPFAKIERALGADTAIVRVMPNTPLQLGAGATQLVKNEAASAAQLEAVRALFAASGVTVVFEREDMLNDVIPYAGSAPAYFYAMADALVQSAMAHGIDEADALNLISQTMLGSARMLREGGKTPAELINQVCSPGGTTLAGMQVLRDRDFYGLIAEMSDKCIARAYELGK